ncbi:VWA domain-containing protein [Gordonia terrae]|uniref:VWA domain-containing protein n=1 Tax=Gordonia terrae TaxID=2055 RepID=UPI003F6BC9C0
MLPWQRPPESFLDAGQVHLCRTWRSGGRFGLLLVGDAGRREAVLAHLRPRSAITITAAMTEADVTADETATGTPMQSILTRSSGPAGVVIPAAELVDPAVAALLDSDRILASAPDVESVPGALLSRLPAIVGLGVVPTIRCRRLPLTDFAAPLNWVVESLAANGFDDHRLDIGACRCLLSMRVGPGSSTRILARHVIEPRLGPMVDAAVLTPEPIEQTPSARGAPAGDSGQELGHDEADVTRVPDPDAGSPTMPEWATVSAAHRYLQLKRPGRRGARALSHRGRVRRVVDYEPTLGLDVHQTLAMAARRGRLDRDTLRSSVRTRRAGRLTIVIVDRSDSMSGVKGRVAAGRAIGAIQESVGNRSKVAVIAAQGASAQLVVEPTRDLRDAHDTITRLPSGGGTPLASAFLLAVGVIGDDTDTGVRVLVVSDGGSNVRLEEHVAGTAESPAAQAETALALLVRRCEQVVVIPTANPGVRVRPGDIEWLIRAGAVVRTAG